MLHNTADKDRAVGLVDDGMDSSMLRGDQLRQNIFPVDFLKILSVHFRIFVGYDKAVPVDDQGISVSGEFHLLRRFLDMIYDHVQRDHIAVGAVLKHFGDGDDHVLCLGIHIGGYDDYFTAGRKGREIPVSGGSIIILGWHPSETVQIFAADVSVQTGKVFVQLVGLHCGLIQDILFDIFQGVAVFQHQFDGISGYFQRRHSFGQVVFQVSGSGNGFVFSCVVDSGYGSTVIDDGIINRGKHHQKKSHDDGED